MTGRHPVWVLAALPAVLGVASLSLGLGDFRSSGLMAGVGLTLASLALIVLLTGRWRRARGVRRVVRVVPIALVGVAGLLGLAFGVPEFAQARLGWFVAPDAHGARSVVAVDGAFLVVGDDPDKGVLLRSDDGRSWTRVPRTPHLEGLEMRDALATGAGILAVGQPSDAAVAQVLESSDGVTWRRTARFGHDVFGVAPTAIAVAPDGIVAAGSTYGNDAVFFRSGDGRRWSHQAPPPVFDDGESTRDVACGSTTCVAIGERYVTGGLLGGDSRRAVAWSSADGGPWVLIDGAFGGATVTAVTASNGGFTAVGHDDGRASAKVWTSHDGTTWTPVGDQPSFHDAQMDGVAEVDGVLAAFGRHRDAIVVWTRTADRAWRRSIVDDGAEPGSRIRALASDGTTIVAAGVDAADGSTAIWTSDDARRWRRASITSTDRPGS